MTPVDHGQLHGQLDHGWLGTAPEAPSGATATVGGPEPPPDDLAVVVPGGAGGPRRRGGWALEWSLVLLLAVGVAFGVRAFVVQTYFIPSASMEPTLAVGDRILVDKLSYHFHGVGRFDIVVFAKPPKEVADPTVKDLVKRVIGLPGDVISSARGQVYINGRVLPEPFLPPGTVTSGIETQKIPPNEYFVMGDNRADSQDSRFFGPIPRSLIVGRVVLRIWPLSRFHLF
jgi:signal peptidase I